MISNKIILNQKLDELRSTYLQVRNYTEKICEPLEIEDYVIQAIVDISPPKWHLAHTTWFYETFILSAHLPGYKVFHPRYSFIFNSYYNNVGERVLRHHRGNLSRPTVKEVYAYRKYVDEAMMSLFDHYENEESPPWNEALQLGLQHEQQHQELLWTDIKYLLGHNPLYPKYSDALPWEEKLIDASSTSFISMEKGDYFIGYEGEGFCFDNELNRHQVHLEAYSIADQLVTNGEFLEFIEDGAYSDFNLWLDEGWHWLNNNKITAPLYWDKIDGKWMNYTLKGLMPINKNEALNHVSFHEGFAFAQWKGMRLPTEQEWEAANKYFKWGERWEITRSAYLPYPGFKTAKGAIGEYNGKFMVNQMTFRGSSAVTSPGHTRFSYRNFFLPQLQWQYTGIRLAK